jgi:hypothetical protein
MEKDETWKVVSESPWIISKSGRTGGTIIYYDVGSRNNYVAWHKEKDMFMGWIGKDKI